MIHRLIILLLIVGCVFGYTIKYNTIDIDGNDYTKSIKGKYAGIYNHKVFVRTEKGGIIVNGFEGYLTRYLFGL